MLSFLLLGTLTIFVSLYSYFKFKFTYWKRLGVPHLTPRFPYGHRQKEYRQISFLLRRHYEALKNTNGWPFIGMYFMHRPIVVPTSLELVKSVLVGDFRNFSDRFVYYNARTDPLSAHLFAINGQQWRKLRQKMTPTFTSGRMKFMYPTMIGVAQRFEQCLARIVGDGRPVELKDLLARFTTDIIGTCAFGIECNCLEDPNTKFREMGNAVFGAPRHRPMISAMIGAFPDIAKWLGVKVFRDDVTQFFMKVVRETVAYREENHIRRNDFLDVLIDLKNKNDDSLTMEEVAAQCFIFFIAGFETSSTTMLFALYELSLNQEIQSKVREEIKKVMRKHEGNFSYEAMMEMQYVDQVINETLRKYPPVASLLRRNTEPYHVSGTNVVLPRGTSFMIPVYAIHYDSEFYPNPESFEPERFTSEQIAKRDKCAFLPFGDGPRNCIGLRFGMMQIRVGLVMLLLNYEFSRCDKTVVPPQYNMNSFVLSPAGGLVLNMRKI